MRIRLIIAAAIAGAATYAALLRDDRVRTSAPSAAADVDPDLLHPVAPAPSPAPAAVEMATTVVAEVAQPEPAPESLDISDVDRAPQTPTQTSSDGTRVLDEGRFAIGGWAAAPGHSVVSAVTYRRQLATAAPAEQVMLTVESAENVPPDGLIVLVDPGFAPDREGFTLLLAAADPGPFSAAGTYRILG